jgi:hypothetical protein
MLWDIRLEFSAAVEYLLMCVKMTPAERRALPGVRRVASPELFALMRCCKTIREGVICSAEVFRETRPPSTPPAEIQAAEDICEALRKKYPVSWEIALENAAKIRHMEREPSREWLVPAPSAPLMC